MASIDEPAVRALLDGPNHAVISTLNADGSVHSNVVWQERIEDTVGINSAVGRRWPTNLQRDPRITLVVYAADNPYEYVEIQGTATSSTAGADAQIDRLANKFTGAATFEGPATDVRISFAVHPTRLNHYRN
jgi:PPOX class probable F420-dependent enzyme